MKIRGLGAILGALALLFSASGVGAVANAPVGAPMATAATTQPQKYLSVLRVVNQNWYPYDTPGWEDSAPIKATSQFQWYEATIYPDAPTCAVRLYRFDNTFDFGKAMSLWTASPASYVAYRESYRLIDVPIPCGLSVSARSLLLREAFLRFFTRMAQDTPSQHYGIRYSGHGTTTGGLFEGQITPSDASWLGAQMDAVIHRKVDFLDLSGPCNEGNATVVGNFYPYFDYILASDLAVGGYNLDSWTLDEFHATDPDYEYPLLVTPATTLQAGLTDILNLFPLRWAVSKLNLIAGQVKQSESLYQTNAFETLATTLAQHLTAHPIDPAAYGYDLYTYIKSLSSSSIEAQFLSLRIWYVSDKSYFPWDVDSNGMAFSAQDALLRPTAVTGVNATAGNAQAFVSWSAPASSGGSTVSGYTVASSPDGKTCIWSGGPLSCTVTGLTNGQAYNFTVTAANSVGTGPSSVPSPAAAPVVATTYHPLTPTRILDSRYGTGLSGPFSSHEARTFQVTGQGGVPPNATAVTGNLTVTQQTSLGFLFIGPVVMNDPTSSTLNFPLGDDRANAVTVALSGNGTLSGTYAAPTLGPTAQVIFDVTGYFTPDATGATYHAITPTRVLDSRYGTGVSGIFSSHVARTVQVTGQGGVPADATAITGNLTVTQQTGLGFLYLGPAAANNPTSSTLNFPVGDDRANAVTVALGAGGSLSATYAAPTLGQSAQVILDVTGYFTPDATGAAYYALYPTRLLDSRCGTGLSDAFSSHSARTFGIIGGSSAVPADATAVTGNLTVTQQTSLGFLYLGPAAADNPTSSTLNFPLNDDRANAVTVALSGTGTLSGTYAAPTLGPTAHVIFDLTGYFAP